MVVHVDEAGGDDMTSGVKGTLGAFSQIADRDYPTVANTDIASIGGHPHAIYDRAVSNDKIILSHSQILLFTTLGGKFCRPVFLYSTAPEKVFTVAPPSPRPVCNSNASAK